MDQDEASPKGATRAWTEEEKNGLLLRVIIQLTTHGSIKWKEVHMPGRTAKSIEGQWTKVKTSLNTIKESMGLPVDVKATPRKSPAKRKVVKLEADDDICNNLPSSSGKKKKKVDPTTGPENDDAPGEPIKEEAD